MSKRADPETYGENRLAVDRYRRHTYNLLVAATALKTDVERLSRTRMKVAPAALADLNAARAILAELPDVPTTTATTRSDKV